MTFKSKEQPFCRYCARPLRKDVTNVNVHLHKDRSEYQRDGWSSRHVYVDRLPQTIEDCRKLTNQQVVSVKRCKMYDSNLDRYVDHGIDRFGEWDGESYADQFFCTGECARHFAHVWAEKGHGTRKWLDKTKPKLSTPGGQNAA